MEWTRGIVIGLGSTATVSLATSLSGEQFAVKSTELSKSMCLQKEQNFMSKLDCPFIVKYIGYDITIENNNSMYNLFMEYMPIGTLRDVIQRHGGELQEHMIKLYAGNILRGLDYLHTEIGLAHCDIKSQNVLISKDGAKIADLGCSRLIERGPAASAFSGTPAFMAPEVARGEEQGFAADIWAVGCTVIEMATGKCPWPELKDPASALYKIGFSNAVPEFPRWLSEIAKDFLSKCFRRNPEQRWTAKELLDHPFLDDIEGKEVKDFTMSSPSCVLDPGFWDSYEGFESPHQNLTNDVCSSNSPAVRIKKLIGSEVINWISEELDWITVRSNDIEETQKCLKRKDEVLVDESSVATEVLSSDTIVLEQEPESSIFHHDFSSEFCIEHFNSISDGSTNGGDDVVLEDLDFETNNDDSCFLQSKLFLTTFLFQLCALTATLIFLQA